MNQLSDALIKTGFVTEEERRMLRSLMEIIESGTVGQAHIEGPMIYRQPNGEQYALPWNHRSVIGLFDKIEFEALKVYKRSQEYEHPRIIQLERELEQRRKELAQAKAIVENAHCDTECAWVRSVFKEKCDCWRSKALAVLDNEI